MNFYFYEHIYESLHKNYNLSTNLYKLLVTVISLHILNMLLVPFIYKKLRFYNIVKWEELMISENF